MTTRGAALPPVLVTEIDGELSLIDGHACTFVAFEQGAAEIEGSQALYVHIHWEAPGWRAAHRDLANCIFDPEEYQRCWIGYCKVWLAEHEFPR